MQPISTAEPDVIKMKGDIMNIATESIFARRKHLYDYIQKGNLGKEVIEELLPDCKPHDYEKQLWDYKELLPVLPVVVKPNNTMLSEFNFKMDEIVKDVVSFYNSYGGYLL